MKLTKDDLGIILQEGEGQKIEFKESFTPAIVKDFVAFANALGGKIFIGVDDRGQIKGVNVTNILKSQITDLAKNCDPSIPINLQVLDKIIIVDIEEGHNKPYQCKEGFFLRQGPNSQKLTRDQIIQFYIDETKIRFDIQINQNFQYPDDFDKRSWKQYLEAIHLDGEYKTEDILVNLGVAQRKHEKFLFNATI